MKLNLREQIYDGKHEDTFRIYHYYKSRGMEDKSNYLKTNLEEHYPKCILDDLPREWLNKNRNKFRDFARLFLIAIESEGYCIKCIPDLENFGGLTVFEIAHPLWKDLTLGICPDGFHLSVKGLGAVHVYSGFTAECDFSKEFKRWMSGVCDDHAITIPTKIKDAMGSCI